MIIVHALPRFLSVKFYDVVSDKNQIARELYRNQSYVSFEIKKDFEDHIRSLKLNEEDVPEQLFDLSNSPSRTLEKNAFWPIRQPLSVGDMVQIGPDFYVCCFSGWSLFTYTSI